MRNPLIDPHDIAILCHETNKTYCETLEDDSQKPWLETSDEFRQSTRDGVWAIIEGRVQKPEDSHNSWLENRKQNGWVWGPEKKVEAKIHPCMVPFEKLPPDQQMKDRLFLAIVLACSEEA